MQEPKIRGAIDACVFHEWTSSRELTPYMSEAWQEIIGRPGDPMGPLAGKSKWRMRNPLGDVLATAYPDRGIPGSSLDKLVDDLLADGRRERVVLGYHEGLLASAFPDRYVAQTMVRAANDWTAAEWLARDERLHGLILVANSSPAEAAEEVRRCAANERFVGVALGANGLGRPFGDPLYLPILEAAHEQGLPVVMQVALEGAADSPAPPLASGPPSTYAEYYAHGGQSFLIHITSLVAQGTFERLPRLRVLVVGGGVAWVPALLWRLDATYMETQPNTPWVLRAPSEYVCEHVRFATTSLEKPRDPGRLAALLRRIPAAESMLLYASGYPGWDFEQPESVLDRLPPASHEAILRGNAEKLFRWPQPAASAATSQREELLDV